jgi:hypothetical protein
LKQKVKIEVGLRTSKRQLSKEIRDLCVVCRAASPEAVKAVLADLKAVAKGPPAMKGFEVAPRLVLCFITADMRAFSDVRTPHSVLIYCSIEGLLRSISEDKAPLKKDRWNISRLSTSQRNREKGSDDVSMG